VRISVTSLDAYRYYCDSEMELDALLRQLRKEEPPTPQMLAGKALHAALETFDGGDVFTLERDGYKFKFVGECAIALPDIRELKGEMQIDTSVGPVTLVGIVDGMDGTEVFDHKLTAQFNAEKYADSYQWRCYLTMFGGRKFTYNCFVGKEDTESGEWVIYDFQPLTFYAYPEMRADVQREVDWFAQFWRKHMEPQSVAA
jgi:Fe-S-cluster containining protein